jgi:hypothetical protein
VVKLVLIGIAGFVIKAVSLGATVACAEVFTWLIAGGHL